MRRAAEEGRSPVQKVITMGSMGDIDTESYIPTSSELGGTASSPTSSSTSSPTSSQQAQQPTSTYQAGAAGGAAASGGQWANLSMLGALALGLGVVYLIATREG